MTSTSSDVLDSTYNVWDGDTSTRNAEQSRRESQCNLTSTSSELFGVLRGKNVCNGPLQRNEEQTRRESQCNLTR